jgi:ATP-dependent protease HslVU (ClpYQ) peptidase subunit
MKQNAMSLVIAYIEDGIVYYGADTQTSTENLKKNSTVKDSLKLKIMDHGFVVGTAGKVRSSLFLTVHKEWFSLPADQPLTKSFLVHQIVNPWYLLCEKEDDLVTETNGVKSLTSTCIVGRNDAVFVILVSGSVIAIPDYAAIGSGSEAALPILMSEEVMPPKTRVLKALKMGAKYDKAVSAPFVVFDSQNLSPELVD